MISVNFRYILKLITQKLHIQCWLKLIYIIFLLRLINNFFKEKVYSLEKDLNYCNMSKPHFDFFYYACTLEREIGLKKSGLTIKVVVVKSYEYLCKPDAAISKSKKSKSKTWNKNYNFLCCYFTISCNIFDFSLFRLSHQYLDFSLFPPSLWALWFYVLPSEYTKTKNNKYLIQVNWNVFDTDFLKMEKKVFCNIFFSYT